MSPTLPTYPALAAAVPLQFALGPRPPLCAIGTRALRCRTTGSAERRGGRLRSTPSSGLATSSAPGSGAFSAIGEICGRVESSVYVWVYVCGCMCGCLCGYVAVGCNAFVLQCRSFEMFAGYVRLKSSRNDRWVLETCRLYVFFFTTAGLKETVHLQKNI